MHDIRAPLLLAWKPHLNEWRSFQTADRCRGHTFTAVIYLREPTQDERRTVEATLYSQGGRNAPSWRLKLSDPTLQPPEVIDGSEGWITVNGERMRPSDPRAEAAIEAVIAKLNAT